MGISSNDLYLHLNDDISRYRVKSCLPNDLPLDAPYTSYRDAATRAILRSIVKKFEPDTPDPHLAGRAKTLFLECNDRCRSFQLSDGPLLRRMRSIAASDLDDLDWQDMLAGFRFGPGASLASRGRNSFFEKCFVNPMTVTSGILYNEYSKYVCKFPNWAAAEIGRVRLNEGVAYEVTRCSSLSTVPKNCSIDRTICTEPSLNMAFQLCLGDAINRVLERRYGYDKALQPDRNRSMAMLGSGGSGHCTIDLTSASDLISLDLIRRVFPRNWFAAVLDCRSPFVRVDGTDHRLYMVSSMGNGFTFPLQTYVFTILIRAVCESIGVPFSRFDTASPQFGVFGDDLVVPHSCYQDVLTCLTELGMKPNFDKSFSGDYAFRESCGTDWYSGRDVRGVYCRRIKTLQDRLSLANRLLRWSARHRVSVTNTIQYILPCNWDRYTVPSDEPDVAGLKVPFSLTSKKTYFYRAFAPKRKLFKVLTRDGALLEHHANLLGFLASIGSGLVSSRGLDRRSDPVRYYVEQRFSPFWVRDSDLHAAGIDSNVDWENFCWLNLKG